MIKLNRWSLAALALAVCSSTALAGDGYRYASRAELYEAQAQRYVAERTRYVEPRTRYVQPRGVVMQAVTPHQQVRRLDAPRTQVVRHASLHSPATVVVVEDMPSVNQAVVLDDVVRDSDTTTVYQAPATDRGLVQPAHYAGYDRYDERHHSDRVVVYHSAPVVHSRSLYPSPAAYRSYHHSPRYHYPSYHHPSYRVGVHYRSGYGHHGYARGCRSGYGYGHHGHWRRHHHSSWGVSFHFRF